MVYRSCLELLPCWRDDKRIWTFSKQTLLRFHDCQSSKSVQEPLYILLMTASSEAEADTFLEAILYIDK